MFAASFVAFAALGGALWLLALFRAVDTGDPPPIDGDEQSPDALEGGENPAETEGDPMQTARRVDYRDTSSHRVGPSAASVRGRQMVRRATSTSGEAAHQRLKGQMEDVIGALSDRLDDKFGRLDDRLARMEKDIGTGALDRASLRSEINETRRDVGELRDAMALQKSAVKPGARAAIAEAAKSPWGRAVIGATGFVAIVSALNNTPDAVRAAERFWHFLAGRDVKAIEVVVPPSPNPPISEK